MGKKIAVHASTLHSRGDVRIFAKECRTIARAGWAVYFVVADGLGDQQVDGVHVVDIGLRRNSRVARAIFDSHSAISRALQLFPDVIHLHDPELLMAVWRLGFRRIHTVYDIHEDIRCQILIKSYIPVSARRPLAKVVGLVEDFVSKRLSGLVVPQKAMLDHFSKVNKRCLFLPNYVDLELYPESTKSFVRPVLFHAGGLSDARGLWNMVALAERLGDRGDLWVAGYLREGVSEDLLGQLKFLGILPYEEILAWYRKANIGLILYNNVGQYGMASAVKCFEYMASGMPIIMPDFGEWPAFNDEVQCGINVDVTDADAVAGAVFSLMSNQGRARTLGMNGRQWVERDCSWQSVSGGLLELYSEILEEDVDV